MNNAEDKKPDLPSADQSAGPQNQGGENPLLGFRLELARKILQTLHVLKYDLGELPADFPSASEYFRHVQQELLKLYAITQERLPEEL